MFRPGDMVVSVDVVRRGDFVYFERAAENEVRVHTVPEGVFRVIERDQAGVTASIDPGRVELVPETPVFLAERTDDGKLMFLPVRVDDPRERLATLRSALLKLPIAEGSPTLFEKDRPLHGFCFFYRDTSSCDSLINLYERGRLIHERGFTDVTKLYSSPVETCRFLIFSREARDVGDPEHGLCVIMDGSLFVVVDNWALDRTLHQVALLHVPAAQPVEAFLNALDVQSMAELTYQARRDFSELSNAPTSDQFTSPDWRARVSAPLGMDDEGTFFMDARCNRALFSFDPSENPWQHPPGRAD